MKYWIALGLAIIPVPTLGTSFHYQTFGPPVAVEDRLILAGVNAKGLLCISVSGQVLWEATELPGVEPAFMYAGRLLVTSRSNVFACNVESGELGRFWSAQGTIKGIFGIANDLAAVTFESNNIDYVACLRLSDRTLIWDIPFAPLVLCHSDKSA